MSQQRQLLRYVLGEVNEAEQQEIETQFFADPNLLHEVQAVCDELIDSYLAGDMPAQERLRFEERLRSLPFLRDYFETNRALLHIANEAQPIRGSSTQRANITLSWRSRLNALFPRLAVASVVAVLLLVFIWLVSKPRQGAQTSEQPVAQATTMPPPVAVSSAPIKPLPTVTPVSPKSVATAKPSTASASVPVIASILLSVDVTRGESQLAQLRVPASKGTVLLQLEVSSESRAFDQVRLQTVSGQEVRTWHKLMPTRYQNSSIVALKVPAQELKTGDYVINLSQETSSAYQFRFHVEAK